MSNIFKFRKKRPDVIPTDILEQALSLAKESEHEPSEVVAATVVMITKGGETITATCGEEQHLLMIGALDYLKTRLAENVDRSNIDE